MCAAGDDTAQILLASADYSLSQSRKQVLENEPGWEVTISRNKQHALALLHNAAFEVLILCSSLSRKVHLEFATVFRQKNPGGRVVLLDDSSPEVQADAVLSPPITPLELIGALRSILAAPEMEA
jgi:DNA-binding NarL/FixJ family response regulator